MVWYGMVYLFNLDWVCGRFMEELRWGESGWEGVCVCEGSRFGIAGVVIIVMGGYSCGVVDW